MTSTGQMWPLSYGAPLTWRQSRTTAAVFHEFVDVYDSAQGVPSGLGPGLEATGVKHLAACRRLDYLNRFLARRSRMLLLTLCAK